MPVLVDKDLCIGCESCVSTCPVESLSMDADGKAEPDDSTCIDCGACISICPVSAITEK